MLVRRVLRIRRCVPRGTKLGVNQTGCKQKQPTSRRIVAAVLSQYRKRTDELYS
jgi:hypothetical protein